MYIVRGTGSYDNPTCSFTGKTVTAITLAKTYEAALLSLDGVVMDAISNGNTPSGLKAREMCAEAAKKRMEMMNEMMGEDGEKAKAAGGLSVEAVTAHTQGASKLAYTCPLLNQNNSKYLKVLKYWDT